MRPPIELLRFMAAAIGLVSAHMLGRDIARRRPVIRWALRFVLSVAALCYLRVDWLAMVVVIAALGLLALGWWLETHRKPDEDLTKAIFGEKDDQ